MHAVRTSRLFSTTHLSSPSPLLFGFANAYPDLFPFENLARMAALLSSHCRLSTASPRSSVSAKRSCFNGHRRPLWFRCSSPSSSSRVPTLDSLRVEVPKKNSFCLKECAIAIALATGLVTGVPALDWPAHASPSGPVLPDLSVLISGPPIKDPGALLRYALPINNKAIREVQKPLEDITDSLKVSGVRALDLVERNHQVSLKS